MFTYADLSKTGHDHFLFNTGYSTVLKTIFPAERVNFYCHQSHFDYIKSTINTSDVIHVPVYILRKQPNKLVFLFLWLYKNIYDFFILRSILRQSKKQQGRFVFFAMMPVRSMLYLLFWHSLFFRKTKVILTFHGEIEAWFLKKKSVTQQFHSFIFKKLFHYKNDLFCFFVPNDFIRKNLQQEPHFQSKSILSIYHLLYPKEIPPTSEKLIIGHIGSTESRKNSGLFFEFAQRLFAAGPGLSKKIDFLVAGKYNSVFDPVCDRSIVSLADQSRILEREYFDQSICSISFSAIFILPDEYLYRESGTVLESLKFYKPIIGLTHPYFEFLERQYGPMGIFAPTMELLVEKIKELLSDKEQSNTLYRELTENIRYMHSQISLPQLSRELELQLNGFGLID